LQWIRADGKVSLRRVLLLSEGQYESEFCIKPQSTAPGPGFSAVLLATLAVRLRLEVVKQVTWLAFDNQFDHS
jgi:hypothetical protein